MKIALAQLRVKANQPQKNVDTMLKMIHAVEHDVDLIVFPELCVGGYLVGDRLNDLNFQDEVIALNDTIRAASKHVGIIWGNLNRKDGLLYNAAYFAYQGEWVHHTNHDEHGVYRKQLLPSYGLFDDSRYFEAGNDNSEPFVFKNQRIAVQVCEDMWDAGHELQPTTKMLEHAPDMMINISCSPWHENKKNERIEQVVRHNLDIPFIYVNATGMQNNGKNIVMFDGGSFVYTPQATYYASESFKESCEIVELQKALIPTQQLSTVEQRHHALIQAIRYFDEETLPYKPKWLVGVSGGLDSSVTVTLLVEALGADRVIGVTMPSEYNREITKNNAYHLAKKLNIRFMEIPIKSMVDATIESIPNNDYPVIEGLTRENIQARLRGHTLMTLSSLENGVIMNNGNKIEVALGYATLYGDAIGALAILGDLTKIEVGEIAQYLNQYHGSEIIPENLIPRISDHGVEWTFAPSAELASDQFDPMKWGYHDQLINDIMNGDLLKFLEAYRDQSINDIKTKNYLLQYGLTDPLVFIDDLKWVMRTMNTAIYKRIQMPPIVVMSRHAFGFDYRESQGAFRITQPLQDVIDEILAEA